MKMSDFISRKIVVIGGGGHIGLPLSLVLSKRGHSVVALDVNQNVVDQINQGRMPFLEEGADELLSSLIGTSLFHASTEVNSISTAEIIIICIGTPVDEYMSPVPRLFMDLLDAIKGYLNSDQLIVLRSTVYPGTTELTAMHLSDLNIDVAFCPERILQGKAIEELRTLPNIVSGITVRAKKRAIELFSTIGNVVPATVAEAEFAKLFLNTYRYIEFATTNQLFTIANDAGVDYAKVLEIMKDDYPRAAKLPGPGLTAGPCLMKDTMQLVAYSQNKFSLGTAAFFANEGLALYLVEKVLKQHSKPNLKVGLLGMAFKADSDDIRASLSYRVKKALQLAGVSVYAADLNVHSDSTLISEPELIDTCDVIIICTPHKAYIDLDYRSKPVIDIWNVLGKGSAVGISNGK